jgi:hypothetical protein
VKAVVSGTHLKFSAKLVNQNSTRILCAVCSQACIINIVAWHLKAGVVKSEKTAIVRQRLVETRFRYDGELKHIFVTTQITK